MKVKVCDALCGSGKTSACIRMMNAKDDRRYMFVTQYLSEVKRIKHSCADRDFVEPAGSIDAGISKAEDVIRLMRNGRNIATTHALFSSYTEETKELITKNRYVLVLDEVIDIMCLANMAQCDLNLLEQSETVTYEDSDGHVKWNDSKYNSRDDRSKFKDEMLQAKSHNLIRFKNECFFWSIPADLFTCFEDVYVLTYMFQSQPLRCFFDVNNIEYELIGVKHADEGYEFCSFNEMDRRRELRDKIHILTPKKNLPCGEGRTDLSLSWYTSAKAESGQPKLAELRRSLYNALRNTLKAPADQIMWTTYKDFRPFLEGKGYKTGFVTYNKRASNEYSDRKYLAYCVNNFPRPYERRFYFDSGSKVNGDMYALSILIQWVFRSAIRKGEEIWLYIPSARMRILFMNWMDNLANGCDLDEIKYKL